MAPSTYGFGWRRTGDSKRIDDLITCYSLCRLALPPSPSTHLLWQFSAPQTPFPFISPPNKTHTPLCISFVSWVLLSPFSIHVPSYLGAENTWRQPEYSFPSGKIVNEESGIWRDQAEPGSFTGTITLTQRLYSKSTMCPLCEWSWSLEVACQPSGWLVTAPSHIVQKQKKQKNNQVETKFATTKESLASGHVQFPVLMP